MTTVRISKKITWLVLATLLIGATLLFALGASFPNILFFSVAFVWTQSWMFGEIYRHKKFRFSFFRLVLELHWFLERRQRKLSVLGQYFFAVIFFIPPLLFCWGLMIWSRMGNLLFPLLGVILGGILLFAFPRLGFSGTSAIFPNETQTPEGSGSGVDESEARDPSQNPQTDIDSTP